MAAARKTVASSAGPAKSRGRVDLATVGGIVIALGGIIGGLLLEKGSIEDVAQVTAALIVLGGTLGAVFVTTPLPTALRAFRGVRRILIDDSNPPAAIIETLIQLSISARRDGIVSLEAEAAAITDPFLRRGMSLAVDGADLQQLRQMMEVDISVMEQNAEAEAKVWEAAGGYAPTVGIIGAVMGLIQVMKHLEDIRMVGHGIAVAFVATLYGVGLANILFLPAAAKLRARLREEVLLKEMALEGVASIAQGLNPTLIRMKLESYAPPGPAAKRAADTNKGAPAVAATSGD